MSANRKRKAPSTGQSSASMLNHELLAPEKSSALKSSFERGKPFRHVHIPNLMDPDALQRVREELVKLDFFPRVNDLNTFFQSQDLKALDEDEFPAIAQLRRTLYGDDMLDIMRKITGIDVDSTPDMAALVFRDRGHLLCHDDEIDQRRIAYILYLVPDDWEEADGGLLELFATDKENNPSTVATRLVPAWNSLACFAVTEDSYHQVSEVTSTDKVRLSISGWFHGPPLKREPPALDPPRIYIPMEEAAPDSYDVKAWINPIYFTQAKRSEVRRDLEEGGAKEMVDFLLEEKYKLIKTALIEGSSWEQVGPPNKRHYERSHLCGPCAFFASKDFAAFLSEMCGFEFTGEAYGEGRKFGTRAYTLVHDGEKREETFVDAVFGCNDEPWDEDWGGQTVYHDDEEEFGTIWPLRNALTLVLCDAGTMRYVKYVSQRAARHARTDISVELPLMPGTSSDESSESDRDADTAEVAGDEAP